MTKLEVGDIVTCTVERIAGTVVFVKIHGARESGKDLEGSIILSEIAPGRIRNLREYVVPKKRIICKVLRISGDRIDLSLRRVTPKEQKEIRSKEKQEKSYKSVLKSVLGNESEQLIKDILKKESVYEFCEKVKTSNKELEKLVGKEKAKKICEILNKQKKKKTIIKKEIHLTTKKPNGLQIIKETLNKKTNGIEIKCLSAGTYTIKTESTDPKKADYQLKLMIENIEKTAKTKGLIFSIKER